MNWLDDAENELVDAVNSGEITESEFNREMRELLDQARWEAEEAADQARDNYWNN